MALDCLQKLVAHRHLRGALRLPAATQAQSSRKRPDGGSEASSVRQSTVEPPATATATASTASSSFFLIDEIIQTVCSAFQLSPNQYVVAEEPVQLQVLKVLLTAITTTSCEVHGVSLLKVIQTCFSIHLNSRNPINQGTAKAILTQTINLVFSRMESYADVLAKKLKEEADVVAAAATTTTTTVHSSDPDTRSINTTSVEFSSHSSSSSTSPAAGSDFDNKDSSPRSSSVVDIRNEKLHSSSSSDDDGIATTTPPVEPATTNVLSSSHSPQTLPSVLNQPKSDSTTDENGMIRIKTTPTNLITTTSTTTTFTDYPTSAYPKSPASSSTNTDSNNNPYDPTIAYYNDLLRKDVFLAFRLLCRLSTHTDNPTQNAESSTQAFSAAAVNQQQGFTDDLSQTSIKARAVAMELILSILNTSGPVLQTDDMYVNLVRQHLCLTVARNGISTHP